LTTPENSLFFSAASIWEIVIKLGLGRADFKVDPYRLRKMLVAHGYNELPVTTEHALKVDSLPPLHKDPFDRLLLAQARTEGMLFLTGDACITRINFLRYSEAEWQRIAGNEFAYCNRMRASDYVPLLQQLDFTIDRHEIDVDQVSMSYMQKKDFSLDERFASYTPDDIYSTSLRILLRKRDD